MPRALQCIDANRIRQSLRLTAELLELGIPMVLGFGCKTMATLTTRTLPSRKERLIVIYLIAFAIPCSPQLALNIAILGRAGIIPFLTAGIFLVLVEIAAGKVLNFVITDDGDSYFIQELPPFRLPLLREVTRKTRYRFWWFLREAVPVFVGAAAAIFLFDLIGLLDMIRHVLSPVVVTWIGLPIDMVEALILLDLLQIRPGAVVRVHQTAPSFVIECDGSNIAIDEEVAGLIFVWRIRGEQFIEDSGGPVSPGISGKKRGKRGWRKRFGV